MGSNEVLSTLPGTESLVMVIMTVMKVKVKSLSHVQLFATPWAVAYHAPPSMGFSRQEYWSGVPLPSLGYDHRPIDKCPLFNYLGL